MRELMLGYRDEKWNVLHKARTQSLMADLGIESEERTVLAYLFWYELDYSRMECSCAADLVACDACARRTGRTCAADLVSGDACAWRTGSATDPGAGDACAWGTGSTGERGFFGRPTCNAPASSCSTSAG